MRKLLIFVLVLGLASISQAAISLKIYGENECFPTPGETVTVTLYGSVYETVGVDFVTLVEATSVNSNQQATAVANMGGSVAAMPTTTVMTKSNEGYLDNYNGVLFDYWQAYSLDGVAANTVLASFNYTFPTVVIGSYWLAPLVPGVLYEYALGEFDTSEKAMGVQIIGGSPVDVLINGVHILPEPATIALLSMGGLLLRRRK